MWSLIKLINERGIICMARRYKYAPPKSPKAPQMSKSQKPRINKTMVAIFVFLISAGLLGSTIIWSLPNGLSGNTPGATPNPDQIKSLVAAVYSDPENANAKVSLANAYMDSKQYPQAIEQYEKAVAKGIKNENIFGDLAINYFYTNQVDKAIENAKKSLEINPAFPQTNVNLAIFLAEGKGDYNGAVAQLEKYLQKDKNNQQALNLLKQYKEQAQSPVKSPVKK